MSPIYATIVDFATHNPQKTQRLIHQHIIHKRPNDWFIVIATAYQENLAHKYYYQKVLELLSFFLFKIKEVEVSYLRVLSISDLKSSFAQNKVIPLSSILKGVRNG